MKIPTLISRVFTLGLMLVAPCALAAGKPSAGVLADTGPSDGALLAKHRNPLDPSRMKVRDGQGRILFFIAFDSAPAIQAARGSSLASADASNSASKIANSKAVVSRRAQVREQQERDIANLSRNLGRDIEPRVKYSLLLNGMTAFLTPDEAAALVGQENVAKVTTVPPAYLETDRGPTWIGAPEVWAGRPGVEGTMGEGVIVGIVDSGIDPHHPSFADVGDDGYDHVNPLGENNYLGDCLRPEYADLCNDKLIGIVSYAAVTDHYYPLRDPVGIDYIGHGTHVASIAAGNVLEDVPVYDAVTEGEDTGIRFSSISGVAPHANIVSYQVCGPARDGSGEPIDSGPCYLDLAVSAVEHAVEHGVDVMNYSIGSQADDPWTRIDAVAFRNAREAGIQVVTSAGNAGPLPETVGDPANAPWIVSVAASTHDRAYTQKQLTSFTGGDTPPRAAIYGASASGSAGPARIVHAQNLDNPWCNEPFPPGTLSGEIVVCVRGINARVEKGKFVRDAGGAGMVLENATSVGPDAELVEDFHLLPAIHISKADGDALWEWLSSGTGHMAEITASRNEPDANKADVVTGFSSRGPNVPNPDIRAIDIAAPGANIYAAMITDQPFNSEPDAFAPFAFQSGTSMASPHAAGAAALIRARHPDWSPAEAQSAMSLTAEHGMRMQTVNEDGRVVEITADVHAEGSGSLRVARAVEAGLVMPITSQEYLDADPAIGGDVGSLNLPALLDRSCLLECEWTRRFKATRAGNWSIRFDVRDPALSLTAEPATFSLDKGEIAVVTIRAAISDPDIETARIGRMYIESTDMTQPQLQMPVEVYFAPGILPAEVKVVAHRDSDILVIPGVRTAGFDNLSIEVNGLVPGERIEAFTQGDETPDKLGDDFETPWHIVEFDVPDSVTQISAAILEADAPDLDLYVIPDNNENGRLDVAELHAIFAGFDGGCYSAGPQSQEACTAVAPTREKYFIGVHNYEGTDETSDRHLLQIAMVEAKDSGNLVVDAPAPKAIDEAFDILATYDVDMEEGDLMVGLVSIGLSEETPGNVGSLSVEIVRGEDDVSLAASELSLPQDGEGTVSIRILGNDSPVSRYYSLKLSGADSSVLIPEDFAVESSGMSHTWNWQQLPGAEEKLFNFRFAPESIAVGETANLNLENGVVVAGRELAEQSSTVAIAVTKPETPKVGLGGGGGALAWLLLLIPLRRLRRT